MEIWINLSLHIIAGILEEGTNVQEVTWQKTVKELSFIVLGCAIFAVGLDVFEVSNDLAAGGITGFATVLRAVAATFGLDLPVGMQTIVMNIVLMLFIVRGGNRKYLAKSVMGFLISSIFVDLFAPFLPALGTNDLMLASLWGSVICGFGLGLVFRAGGNTGGTDIIAQAISKRFSIPSGTSIIIVDMAIIIAAIPVFSLENALYSALAIFITGKMIDYVIDGPKSERCAYIISSKHSDIAHEILYSLNRGCTELQARGVWSGSDKPVLMCVLGRTETIQLKTLVSEIDPNAIVFISEVHEAFGEGFKPIEGMDN